jgi:hypothetical protein
MIFSLLQRSSVNIRIVTQYTTGALPKDLTVLYAYRQSKRNLQLLVLKCSKKICYEIPLY